jgi:hypothetical protein
MSIADTIKAKHIKDVRDARERFQIDGMIASGRLYEENDCDLYNAILLLNNERSASVSFSKGDPSSVCLHLYKVAIDGDTPEIPLDAYESTGLANVLNFVNILSSHFRFKTAAVSEYCGCKQ